IGFSPLFAVLAVFDLLGALVIWTVLKNKPADDDTPPLSSRKPATQS
ncbi:MFS transporter, partial [Klebsiella quasipneumoniae]